MSDHVRRRHHGRVARSGMRFGKGGMYEGFTYLMSRKSLCTGLLILQAPQAYEWTGSCVPSVSRFGLLATTAKGGTCSIRSSGRPSSEAVNLISSSNILNWTSSAGRTTICQACDGHGISTCNRRSRLCRPKVPVISVKHG